MGEIPIGIVVLYNGELCDGVFKSQYESYVNSFNKLGIDSVAIPSSEYITKLFENEMKLPQKAVFLDKDIYSATFLEQKGVKLYNSAECIRICDDKALTYINLYKNRLPIPKTIIAPKTYSKGQAENWCKKAAGILGYPLVVKECFGSLGKQVYLAENEFEMLDIVKKLGAKPFLFQKFLSKGAGWDLRVIVADGQVIGAIKRSNDSDFRANAAQGGEVEAIKLSGYEKELAIKAAESTGAFFAGVDLIMGEDGFLVCEVNSNMLFQAADKALKSSISDCIAEKIINHSLNK